MTVIVNKLNTAPLSADGARWMEELGQTQPVLEQML